MNVFDFIFGILVLVVIAFLWIGTIGTISTIWDTKKLEKNKRGGKRNEKIK